jgi:hypothetical protein
VLSNLKRGTISKTWDRDGSVLQHRSTISDNYRSKFIGTATTASIQGTKKRRSPGNHLTKSLPYPSRALKSRLACRSCEKEEERGSTGQRRAWGLTIRAAQSGASPTYRIQARWSFHMKIVAGPKPCRRQIRAVRSTRRSAYRIRPDSKAT